MRPTVVAVLALLLAGLPASTAYWAPISVKRLFRPGRRTLRLRDSHTFTQGYPDQIGGGFTEVRTIEVTIRKLR